MNEAEAHPHVPVEQAHLFTGHADGSTEVEYLELVRSLVRVSKPALIFESGCHHGLGTVALADACRANCHGRVVSIDTDQAMVDETRRKLDAAGLRDLANVRTGDSREYLRTCGLVFDFLFLDSELEIRVEELLMAIGAGSLAPGGLVVFHDTSRLRTIGDGQRDARSDTFWGAFEAARGQFAELIEFPLSRGLLVGRIAPHHC